MDVSRNRLNAHKSHIRLDTTGTIWRVELMRDPEKGGESQVVDGFEFDKVDITNKTGSVKLDKRWAELVENAAKAYPGQL